ncbi:PTS glucose transporter subunit IIA [Actinotalea sp. K2]|uniref:PTS sugar transporter subunit IIA n=1 Tax=Actinotalea sp. K2 TaxID=2939438 RepID=UPI002017EDA8|nr:PTS glucose transporter subunit IIA [Actinotalea sp. K2]MCL3860335.1 PTS glucose transporter subunit IIA [Actinotalea sp. K2]
MTAPLRVVAPVSGTVLAMSGVPDPVFAGEIVGPGLAVDPTRGPGEAISPIAGTILKLHPHAFVVQAPGSHAVLVHLGLDTVQLGGVGFTLHVAEGDVVQEGTTVVSWNPLDIEAGGRSPICPVVALEGTSGALEGLVEPGATVKAGDPLFVWS